MADTNITTPVEKKADMPQKDGLALVVGGLFILALVFAAYNYFSKGTEGTVTDTDKKDLGEVVVDKKDDNTKKEEKEEKKDDKKEVAGDLNGKGAADVKVEDKTPTKVQDTTPSQPAKVDTTVSNTTTATYGLNDYKQGDIKAGSYTVKAGDTLWEISEAVYGNGAEWTKILNANSAAVGYLPNGQQALIVPGQTLVLP